MSTRSLTGWLLIAGPLLTFLMIAIVYPAVIGEGETSADAVKEAMAELELARVLGMAGTLSFVSVFIGMTLLARSMQGDDNPGGAYAAVAGIVFTAVAALAILASGLGLGAMDAAETNTSDGVTIGLVGDGVFSPLFVFWGVANLMVGMAMVIQKNLHLIVAWLFVGWGVFMIAISAISADIPDAVGNVLWLGLNLTMVAAGVLTLRAKQAS